MVIVDLFTDYNAVKIVKEHDAVTLFRSFEKARISWAGPPDMLVADGEAGFAAEQFNESLTRIGTVMHPSAAYAPWQKGKAERKINAIKDILEKLVVQYQTGGVREMKVALYKRVTH